MLTKAEIKQIKSLEYKKFRDQYGLFIAEGEKLVGELLQSDFEVNAVYALNNAHLPKTQNAITEISANEMSRISALKTPAKALATIKIPQKKLNISDIENKLVIALDCVQDPGNLGTIMRLADWFDIRTIVCSRDTADCFSPKTVQATMGAISRVKMYYVDLPDFLSKMQGKKIYGTFLEGKSIYAEKLLQSGVIVMGNEGKGISPEVEKLITDKINIPCFSTNKIKPESLNVATATAVICSEFKRRF